MGFIVSPAGENLTVRGILFLFMWAVLRVSVMHGAPSAFKIYSTNMHIYACYVYKLSFLSEKRRVGVQVSEVTYTCQFGNEVARMKIPITEPSSSLLTGGLSLRRFFFCLFSVVANHARKVL
jgi:hypothetical protein